VISPYYHREGSNDQPLLYFLQRFKDRFKNAGMEWPVIEELKELLRFWKTDLEFKKEKEVVCYATRTVGIINKVDRLVKLLDVLHEVNTFESLICYKI